MTGPGPSDPAGEQPLGGEPPLAPPPAAPAPPAAQPAAPAPASNTWTAMSAPVTAGPAGYVYADVPNRAIAYIIDAIILAIIGILVAIVLGAIGLASVNLNVNDPNFGQYSIVAGLVAALINTAINGAYFIYTWTTMRASPGQKVLGMQVGNAADGATLTTEQAIKRLDRARRPVRHRPGPQSAPGPRAPHRPGGPRVVHRAARHDRPEPDQAGAPRPVRQHGRRQVRTRRRLIARSGCARRSRCPCAGSVLIRGPRDEVPRERPARLGRRNLRPRLRSDDAVGRGRPGPPGPARRRAGARRGLRVWAGHRAALGTPAARFRGGPRRLAGDDRAGAGEARTVR